MAEGADPDFVLRAHLPRRGNPDQHLQKGIVGAQPGRPLDRVLRHVSRVTLDIVPAALTSARLGFLLSICEEIRHEIGPLTA